TQAYKAAGIDVLDPDYRAVADRKEAIAARAQEIVALMSEMSAFLRCAAVASVGGRLLRRLRSDRRLAPSRVSPCPARRGAGASGRGAPSCRAWTAGRIWQPPRAPPCIIRRHAGRPKRAGPVLRSLHFLADTAVQEVVEPSAH